MMVMNWQILLSDITRAGITQVDMAKEFGCAQSTISDLARGVTRSPNFELGQHLFALHKKVVRKSRKKESHEQHATSSQAA